MTLIPFIRRRRRRLLFLFYCSAGSILIITLLAFFSGTINRPRNGFIRLAPPHVAIPGNIRDLHANSWYIAGGTPTRFYLANHLAPALMQEIDIQLKDSILRPISIHSASNHVSRSLNITVDSPHICFAEGVSPLIAEGHLGDSLLQRHSIHTYFGLAEPLSPSSHILRVIESHLRQNILIKAAIDTTIRQSYILEKQVDGIFCTDGYLHAQPDSNRLIYIYSYRNQFVCLDTNLNVRYQSHTIDTVSRVKFSVGSIPSKSSITLSSPPTFVNEQSCISGNYLFVHSGLRADNDESEFIDRGSPIDVYSLTDGSYLLSFYLPDYQRKKMKDFRVFGNTLVALYDHYAYTYTLYFPPKLRK